MTTQFESIWDALEDDPVKIVNLKLRSSLMMEINANLDRGGKTQADIAAQIKTTQPRVSALRKGKINEFRLDILVDFVTRLELSVSIEIAA